jgi:hypothetical protein
MLTAKNRSETPQKIIFSRTLQGTHNPQSIHKTLLYYWSKALSVTRETSQLLYLQQLINNKMKGERHFFSGL